MDIFISLGVELGKREVWGGTKYRILVGHRRFEVTELEYSIYYLGQMGRYNVLTASEELNLDLEVVRRTVENLVEQGILIYWNNINKDFYRTHSITARGSSSSKHKVRSVTFAVPSQLTQFTNELWVFSNPLISIDEVFINMEYYLGYTYRTCCVETMLASPSLIREGLISLNPLTQEEESDYSELV